MTLLFFTLFIFLPLLAIAAVVLTVLFAKDKGNNGDEIIYTDETNFD